MLEIDITQAGTGNIYEFKTSFSSRNDQSKA